MIRALRWVLAGLRRCQYCGKTEAVLGEPLVEHEAWCRWE